MYGPKPVEFILLPRFTLLLLYAAKVHVLKPELDFVSQWRYANSTSITKSVWAVNAVRIQLRVGRTIIWLWSVENRLFRTMISNYSLAGGRRMSNLSKEWTFKVHVMTLTHFTFPVWFSTNFHKKLCLHVSVLKSQGTHVYSRLTDK